MKSFSTALVLLAFSPLLASASLCDPEDSFQPAGLSAPIQRRAQDQRGIRGNVPAVPVAGTLQIIDGCSFQVSDFTFQGNADSTYEWWGVNLQNSSNGFPISETPILNASNSIVTFRLDAPQPFNFAEFTVIQLFDVTNEVFHATITLPEPTVTAGAAAGNRPAINTRVNTTRATGSPDAGVTSVSAAASLAVSGLFPLMVVAVFYI